VSREKIVFLDLETAGLEVTRPIIQIAAIAVDENLNEIETFEAKVRFNKNEADPRSLRKKNYLEKVWEHEALPPAKVAQRFSRFLRKHATVDCLSADGKRYQLAQLAAHNGERFDGPFLHAWFRRQEIFCPARYMVLCTKQRLLWLFEEDKTLTPPADFKLGTLCQYFGVRLPADEAHDALNDVRATAALYRVICEHSRRASEAA
jgi:DNA polymerase III epsilon subunit-like protein